ncbi:TetR/AcrR family transcriptional regulator [Tsukamurella sp. M9C]|uniref:TetR/AcrR family transcriptional regulator n=1 Tax=Tsukamurella sp. M9C TaxID=2877520 RepID=UPI001CCC8106|nr:TetR/AcrR family transcriptional regulator [Tsukamurella sp. M9C]MCA0156586.1 TetR/AcrR family transcriptional regulator [Tsukamurella sp. M9C]
MTTPTPRRGRPPSGTAPARREAVLDAALALLIERGYAAVTMQAVAERVRGSKETLYRWFDDRDGLFAAIIERNADASVGTLVGVLSSAASPNGTREALTSYARALLTLLTSPSSVALNRAAMGNERLSRTLLYGGRHRAGPAVEQFLKAAHTAGIIDAPDPTVAFGELYGLTVRDTQIRVLLGEKPPTKAAIDRRATEAVAKFLLLHAPRDDAL